MKRRRGVQQVADVKYSKLDTHTNQDDDSDSEEDEVESRVEPPWASIALASFLFIAGAVLLVYGILFTTGVISDKDGKATPMLIVGSICFIPGLYNIRMVYYAWKGNHGYTFHDIPS